MAWLRMQGGQRSAGWDAVPPTPPPGGHVVRMDTPSSLERP